MCCGADLSRRLQACTDIEDPRGSRVRALPLLGDDFVLYFCVRSLRDDATRNELVFGGVRTSLDDLVGVGGPDAGESFELIRGRGIDID